MVTSSNPQLTWVFGSLFVKVLRSTIAVLKRPSSEKRRYDFLMKCPSQISKLASGKMTESD
ncbi:hypothetical protein HanIR_Chr14g0701571 [Helianthus annuus]|nr:hypothetical protein HanIR_Chr14g0701571 [Helianthus annuus]